MKSKIEVQSDFNSPELYLDSPHILYFSKKSPFKDTCNEDAIAVFSSQNGYVFAVADGAGGHPKGEEAAALVLNNLKKFLNEKKENVNIRTQLIDSIEYSNKELLNSGVGARTTVTICEVSNNKARCYQVGDSTLVICGQKGKLKYRSTSHSPVGYGIEAGLIDEKEALKHPDLHFISNLVGESGMKIEIGPEIELNPNDSVFLASDGIFDNFPTDEIIDLVRKGNIDEISKDLMSIINNEIYGKDDSKKDDISFILYKNDSI
jgi:PPM family protein phosphatase